MRSVSTIGRRVGDAGRLDDHARGTAGSRPRRAGRAGRAARRRGRRAATQQTQPLASRTVRSSTRRRRWWSMPTSPSSFTITAVSPSSGPREQREMSVVLPLPRKPVTRTTGVFTVERRHECRIERVERPPGEALGLDPERPRSSTTSEPPLPSRTTYAPPHRRTPSPKRPRTRSSGRRGSPAPPARRPRRPSAPSAARRRAST